MKLDCWLGSSDPATEDRRLTEAVDDGRLDAEDADTIRMFGDFLRECGGPVGKATLPQAQAWCEWLSDPVRRAFIGVSEKEAEKAVTAIKAKIERGGYGDA